MGNIFVYLKWRDDLEFNKLNEIDVLVFNKLSYLPLENIINKDEKMSISELYKKSVKTNNVLYSQKEDREFFRIISKSVRYRDILVGNVVSKLDFDNEEQFMAITIYLPNDTIFVAFRGTTEEIIAWKEDFNMSYKVVPAQIDALDYVNNLSLNKKIYLGGHSKGGNLAMYAGVNANMEIKDKIVKIYNFDGPGFTDLSDNYLEMKDKIINYIPSDSVVGRLFKTEAITVVVKSSFYGIKQHNLYSWQIEKDSFVLSSLSKESNKIKIIIDEFISKIGPDERKKFIENIYDIITSSGVLKISDLDITDFKDFILSYKNIDIDSKKLLFTIIKYLFDSAKDNIKVDLR